VGKAWQMFLAEGPRLPWYRVLSLTASPDNRWLDTWWVPTVLLAVTAATAAAIWRIGSRLEKKERLEEAYGVSQP